MAAGGASLSFGAKTSLFWANFGVIIYTTRCRVDGKIRYVAIFFLFEKKHIVNLHKFWFYLVVFFFYCFAIASLSPRFLKMKYCSSPHAFVTDRVDHAVDPISSCVYLAVFLYSIEHKLINKQKQRKFVNGLTSVSLGFPNSCCTADVRFYHQRCQKHARCFCGHRH